MRVDNHIRDYSFSCEGKILLTKSHATSPLLPMPWSKLIPNLWNTNASDSNFSKFIACWVLGHNHHINNPLFSPARPKWSIFKLSPDFHALIFIIGRSYNLSDKDLLILNNLTRRNDPVWIKLFHNLLKYLNLFTVRFAYFTHGGVAGSDIFFTFISAIEYRTI